MAPKTIPPRPKAPPTSEGQRGRPAVPVWRPNLDLRQPKTPPEPDEEEAETPEAVIAQEVLAEVNEKDVTVPSSKSKRRARPERPSQIARVTGRSFERLAGQLADSRVNETELKSQLANKVAELEVCQQQLAASTTRCAELEKNVTQLSDQHHATLASISTLQEAGQSAVLWKNLFENTERARHELQELCHKQQKDFHERLQSQIADMNQISETRLKQVKEEHHKQLVAKCTEIAELKEELLQKDQQLQQAEGQKEIDRKKKRERERDRKIERCSKIKTRSKPGTQSRSGQAEGGQRAEGWADGEQSYATSVDIRKNILHWQVKPAKKASEPQRQALTIGEALFLQVL